MSGVPLSARELQARLDALPRLDDGEVAATARACADPGTVTDVPEPALAETAVRLLDLTSLAATDTPTSTRRLAERARTPDPASPEGPGVAAVCVWPDLAGVAAEALADSDVRVAAVAGAFPSARSPLHVRVAEVEATVAAGADEVDVVIDRGALAEGRPHDAMRQLLALREACGPARMKVILETGALPDADAVQRAAWVALLGGADLVKTSTGKDGPGASLAAVWVLLHAARELEAATGRRAGVKISGGVRTAADAAGYLALVRSVGGEDWWQPERCRIGASSLLDALVAVRREP